MRWWRWEKRWRLTWWRWPVELRSRHTTVPRSSSSLTRRSKCGHLQWTTSRGPAPVRPSTRGIVQVQWHSNHPVNRSQQVSYWSVRLTVTLSQVTPTRTERSCRLLKQQSCMEVRLAWRVQPPAIWLLRAVLPTASVEKQAAVFLIWTLLSIPPVVSTIKVQITGTQRCNFLPMSAAPSSSGPTTYKLPLCCSAPERQWNGTWRDTATRPISFRLSWVCAISTRKPISMTLSIWPEPKSSHQVVVLAQAPASLPSFWPTVRTTCPWQARRSRYRTPRSVKIKEFGWSQLGWQTKSINNASYRLSHHLTISTPWTTSRICRVLLINWRRNSMTRHCQRVPRRQPRVAAAQNDLTR